MSQIAIDERNYLDPVFLQYGKEVYTQEYIDILRKNNLDLKRKGKRVWDMVPQAGFQENVSFIEADIKIIGGKRGGGKTHQAIAETTRYADNPDVNMYGFRRLENDVKRGIWKSCKPILRGLATFADTNFEAKFFGGNGATLKMEHLQDLSKVKDRFRGAEMPYIIIEELAEFTKENMNVIFDLIPSNRSTAGVPSQFICTCNPVGRSNSLRYFLEWWIDPETDLVIPERSGKVRYMCRYGEDILEIAWGDSPEEVYENPLARTKIQSLSDNPDRDYENFITSVTFIDGEYSDNKILQAADPKYMNKISAGGAKSTINDIRGVWRDVDVGTCELSIADFESFFANPEQDGDGVMRASCDVALTGDQLTIFAARGRHIVDFETRRGGFSDDVIPFIEAFLQRNSVRKENFTFDTNGLGLWIGESEAFKGKAVPFNNKSAPSNNKMWNNLKSECFEKFVKNMRAGKWSIEDEVLRRKITDKKGRTLSLRDKFLEERAAFKRKDADGGRYEVIDKKQMKIEVGHSPDVAEGIVMFESLMERQVKMKTKGLFFMC